MTCREVMTRNPECCTPDDSVARAAQLMKLDNIGAVPIIDNRDSRRLVGIVTDRDLTLNVIAEGRNPHSICVGDVMSESVMRCSENDDIERAIDLMTTNQIRRIPVVDRNQRLIGIIAQADIARRMNEDDTGEMVRDISRPGLVSSTTQSIRSAFSNMSSSRGFGADTSRADVSDSFSSSPEDFEESRGSGLDVSSLLIGAACVGIGAGLMYFMDPGRGGFRRGSIRDRAMGALNTTGDALAKAGRDLGNRATGVAAEARSHFKSEPTSDEKLVQRVRSHLGHDVSHPRAIHVESNGGNITLTGHILRAEMDRMLTCLKAMSGVNNVENRLEVHDSAANIPSLQGGSTPGKHGMGALAEDWPPGIRLLAGILGAGLAFYGVRGSGPVPKVLGLVGLGLAARGATNADLSHMVDYHQITDTVSEWMHFGHGEQGGNRPFGMMRRGIA